MKTMLNAKREWWFKKLKKTSENGSSQCHIVGCEGRIKKIIVDDYEHHNKRKIMYVGCDANIDHCNENPILMKKQKILIVKNEDDSIFANSFNSLGKLKECLKNNKNAIIDKVISSLSKFYLIDKNNFKNNENDNKPFNDISMKIDNEEIIYEVVSTIDHYAPSTDLLEIAIQRINDKIEKFRKIQNGKEKFNLIVFDFISLGDFMTENGTGTSFFPITSISSPIIKKYNLDEIAKEIECKFQNYKNIINKIIIITNRFCIMQLDFFQFQVKEITFN